MNDDTLECLTRQHLDRQSPAEVTFAWQGGEPTLLGIDFYRRALALQEKYRRPGVRIRNAFQTNGVNLNREWAEFLKANDFLVGLSLDGPEDLHNAYRVDKRGQPTFERVMAGLHWLQTYQVDVNILACVHQSSVEHPVDVYRFFRDTLGIAYLQFIPIVEIESGSSLGNRTCVTQPSISGPQYGFFLESIFYEWVHRDVGAVYVQLFDVALAAWLGAPPGLCVFAETCGDSVVVEHTGDVYSCDHYVTLQHHLGNLHTTALMNLVCGKAQARFSQAKQTQLPEKCKRCPVLFVCNGGCPKNRIARATDGSMGLNWLCVGYRSFFSYIDPAMRWMAELVRTGRSAAEIIPALKANQLDLPAPEPLANRNKKHRR